MGLLSRMGRAATALSKYYYPFTWRNKPSIESPLNEVHLNHIEDGINEMDNRILILAQDKADATDIANVFVDFAMDDTTGVMTFTRFDGSKVEHDSAVEKIALNCYLEDDNFVLELADGTKQKVSLSKFIDTYEFSSTDTIRMTVNGKNISAEIPDGKITLAKLEPTIISTIRKYTLDAQTAQGVAEQAAGTAQGWAIGGIGFEDNNAKHYASRSQRYAVGGVEEGDTEDNAKYYCQQAQAAAEQATGAAGFDGTASTVSAIDTQGVAVRKASGTGNVTITDAAEHPILNLNLTGKSEQVVTAGAQLLDISTAGNYYINGQGNASSNNIWIATDYIPVVAGQQYKLTTKDDKYLNAIVPFDIDKKLIGTILVNLAQTKGLFTAPENVAYIRIRFYNDGGDFPVSMLEDAMPMLNAGATPLPWEPYTGGKPSPSLEYPQPIKGTGTVSTGAQMLDVTVTGEQLLDLTHAQGGTNGGITIVVNKDGSYTCSGTATNSDINVWFLGKYMEEAPTQFILKSGTYYKSGIRLFNGRKIIGPIFDGEFTLAEDTPVTGVRALQLEAGKTYSNYTVYPMINAGSTALPWQPYQSRTASITLTAPLHGIGDVRDRIMCRDGVWGIERQTAQIILNGSENWNDYQSTFNGLFGYNVRNRYKTQSFILSDYYGKPKSPSSYEDNKAAIDNYANVWIVDKRYTNVAALKNGLKNNPITVVAELVTPTWEPLPSDTQSALNALTTYTGTTHVTITAGGPEPDVGMEYFGQPGDKVTVQDMCDSFAAPGFDDSGVVEEITSFQSFYDKFVSGMKIRDFLRNLKAGLKFVLHTGQLVNNGLCNEPGKYPLDAAYGRTLLEMIGNTADLPGGAADIVSAIVTQNSNLSNVSKTATAANNKVTLNGVRGIIGFTQTYPDRVDRALQMQYESGEIASITFNGTGIWYDFYNGTTWEQVWKFNKPT